VPVDAYGSELQPAGCNERGCAVDLLEQRGDVHTAVRRRVRAQAAGRLLELPSCTRRVAASGVMPGDGDVDQALQEVALGVRGRSPFGLERLVGRVVGARSDQVESVLEAHTGSIAPSSARGSVPVVATILLVGVDLFFRAKLEGLLVGHRVVTSDSVDTPDLVVCDIARVEPGEVADAWPDVPIVGFTNHTDRDGLRRAHTAGFDQVIVKSALVERAREIVAELVGDDGG